MKVDTKTAVLFLRETSREVELQGVEILPVAYNDVADLIEQQEKQINDTKQMLVMLSGALEELLYQCEFINSDTYENIDVDSAEIVLIKYKKWDGGSGE